eukprot:Em0001g943a
MTRSTSCEIGSSRHRAFHHVRQAREAHLCNLKKVQVFGGMDVAHVTLLSECTLGNTSVPETINLTHPCKASLLASQYIKIVAVQSWGLGLNYSVWYVKLKGLTDVPVVQKAISDLEDYKEKEALLLCMKQYGYTEPFASLKDRAGVVDGDWKGTEQAMEQAAEGDQGGSWPGMRGGHQMCVDPNKTAITSLSHNDRAELHKKFDTVFLLAQEKQSFLKYPSICELEECHGVQVGSAYRTEKAAKSFSHYIAQCQRQQLVETVKSVKFFSLLLDGSTDAANVENELILVMLFDKEGVDEKVVTHSQLLKINSLCHLHQLEQIYVLFELNSQTFCKVLNMFCGWDGDQDLGDLWRFDVERGTWECVCSDTSLVGTHQLIILGGERDKIFVSDMMAYITTMFSLMKPKSWLTVTTSRVGVVYAIPMTTTKMFVFVPLSTGFTLRATLDHASNIIYLYTLVRPSVADVLRRSRHLLRRQKFREMASIDPMEALSFLKTTLASTVDHRDPDESDQFRQLASTLFNAAGNASLGNSAWRLERMEVYNALTLYFPSHMTQPRSSLVDLISIS